MKEYTGVKQDSQKRETESGDYLNLRYWTSLNVMLTSEALLISLTRRMVLKSSGRIRNADSG